MSDVTGNDETCSEVDTVTNDIDSARNIPSTQQGMLTMPYSINEYPL